MKNIYTVILGTLLLITSYTVKGQSSFSFQKDTIWYSYTGTGVENVPDYVINPSTVPTDSVQLSWKVIYTDFPEDWQGATGICDNYICYPFSGLWPSSVTKYSSKYPDGTGDFHMQVALNSVSPAFDATNGSHYVIVRAHNYNIPNDSATVVFIIGKIPAATPKVQTATNDVVLYPNPAGNELNVVFDGNNDVKNIAVYNIIGKVMTVFKVAGTSANLNIENIPPGIYLVRLYNNQGNAIATRKFTKQ